MTTLLETAFQKISALPELEQNIYAKNLLDEMSYTNSDDFVKDKVYLEGIVKDIDEGTATLLIHDEVWSKIEAQK